MPPIYESRPPNRRRSRVLRYEVGTDPYHRELERRRMEKEPGGQSDKQLKAACRVILSRQSLH